ncbi:hypothetical protein H2O73_15545 [Vibrio sp. 404]|uniref:DUF2059 domain-containing protein n=1 Tax=Vibrio marinisediminis TaxID=2758441 RepID=A0A7W2IUX9_9VIBR|nr:hypothetical protein [Vibrio marinisediminis]MBA5763778.1 hypothetical protein [Vibrio marinisediminis]
MKVIKWIGVGVMLPFAHLANAEPISQQQLNLLFQDLTSKPTALVKQFSQYSVEENLTVFLTTTAEKRPDELVQVISQLFIQYPQHVRLIAQIARELGLPNQAITIAAIEAGIDPTVIAEATAAGPEIANAQPIPNAPTKKNPISAN